MNSDPAHAADYIGVMAKELLELAAKAKLDDLAYLLAMVVQEAEHTAKGRVAAESKSG